MTRIRYSLNQALRNAAHCVKHHPETSPLAQAVKDIAEAVDCLAIATLPEGKEATVAAAKEPPADNLETAEVHRLNLPSHSQIWLVPQAGLLRIRNKGFRHLSEMVDRSVRHGGNNCREYGNEKIGLTAARTSILKSDSDFRQAFHYEKLFSSSSSRDRYGFQSCPKRGKSRLK